MRKEVIISLLLCGSAELGCTPDAVDPGTGAAGSPAAPGVNPPVPTPAAGGLAPAGAAGGAAPVTTSTPPASGAPTVPVPVVPPVAQPPVPVVPPGTPTANTPPVGDLPPATGVPIPKECRGFEFEGLVYSPGGNVMPNVCAAFHPTLNNPYAVRCVDAWPWWKTRFAGDNYCILPPPPDKGVQIGHHVQGDGDTWFAKVSKGDMSDYDNPIADWVLPPGGEEERNIQLKYANAAGKYYRIYARMRGGSHHMIVSTIGAAAQTHIWGPGGADGLFTGNAVPGAQRPDENAPQSLTKPDEDKGLYREFPANAIVNYNVHHFNSTENPILKEAWQNLWWEPEATIKIDAITGLPILQAVGTFAQPGEIVDMHYASTILAPMRVLSLFGHRHAWTTNFTSWVERAGMPPEIVYQSFDWFDEPTYSYSSEVKNPVPAPEKRSDGAHSGVLMLNAGDRLHFNCHIEYTDARAKEENSPVTPAQNGPLRFANEAFNAEMCILFGAAVGSNGTMEQLGPPPDFAKTR